MFSSYPSYPRYRALHLTDPQTTGEDVYALQAALTALGFDTKGLDGILGGNTASAIKAFQAARKLGADGIAGPATQRRLAVDLITRVTKKYQLIGLLLYGQIGHECGFVLGNYSEIHLDGSWDAGAAQENSHVHDVRHAFTTDLAIDDCGAHCRLYYDKFVGVANDKRRWGLAAGAWNAPAFACYIAHAEGATQVVGSEMAEPSADARAALEAYIADVTVYL